MRATPSTGRAGARMPAFPRGPRSAELSPHYHQARAPAESARILIIFAPAHTNLRPAGSAAHGRLLTSGEFRIGSGRVLPHPASSDRAATVSESGPSN